MNLWEKYNIHVLTVAGIAVAVYLVVAWDGMDPVQRALGFFIAGITLHEWEETRYPGGFFKLMTRMLGILDVTEQKMGRAHGAVVLAIALFAFAPFFLSGIRWLAMVPGILGVFEAFVHVAGIKIHHLKRPYTPGMATALLCLLPSSVAIFAFGAAGVEPWQWALSIAYYVAVFALMELCVWGSFGISPRELPKMAQHARRYALGDGEKG